MWLQCTRTCTAMCGISPYWLLPSGDLLWFCQAQDTVLLTLQTRDNMSYTAVFRVDNSSKIQNVWETEHLKITEHFHNPASYLGKTAVTAHSGITESKVLTISVFFYFVTPAKGSGTLFAGLSDPAESESRNLALLTQRWRRSCMALWRTSSVQQHTYHLMEFMSEQMTKKKPLTVLLSFYFGSVFTRGIQWTTCPLKVRQRHGNT